MKIWIVLVITLSVALTPAYAKQKEKSYALSIKVFKPLEKAQLLVEEESYAEAFEVLNEVLEKKLSPYERAQVYTLKGSFHYKQGNNDAALSAFTKVLESEGEMPLRLLEQTLKTLSQMHMIKDEYEAAKNYCIRLIDVTETPDQLNFALLAQAHYKLEQWDETLNAASRGRALAYEQLKDPDENILLLMNAAHFERNTLDAMPAILEELIRLYPKKSYILYLASIYGQLDQMDKQTVLMESLYDDGKLTEHNQLRNLASLYMSEKTPYKGALVLEKALTEDGMEATARDYELLAQAWQLAAERQKATIALEQAAQLSDDGDNYLKKAYLHFDMAQWNQVIPAAMAGLDKGMENRKTGEAWLLIGMTRFKLKQFKQAIDACERATEFDNTKDHAQQWISYITREKRKRDSMMPAV